MMLLYPQQLQLQSQLQLQFVRQLNAPQLQLVNVLVYSAPPISSALKP
jgi:hypothetical protein